MAAQAAAVGVEASPRGAHHLHRAPHAGRRLPAASTTAALQISLSPPSNAAGGKNRPPLRAQQQQLPRQPPAALLQPPPNAAEGRNAARAISPEPRSMTSSGHQPARIEGRSLRVSGRRVEGLVGKGPAGANSAGARGSGGGVLEAPSQLSRFES